MFENSWQAGKGENVGEESYMKNPWRFFSNGYFVSQRDEHHGVWQVYKDDTRNKIVLKLKWNSNDGHAKFELNSSTTFKCYEGGWDFMRSWNLVKKSLEGSVNSP